ASLKFWRRAIALLAAVRTAASTAGQSFSCSGDRVKPAWRAAIRASRKAARSAGGKTCVSVPAGTLTGAVGCPAWPLEAASTMPEPTRAIIVKAKGKPGFMGVLQFSIVARSAKPFRLSQDHLESPRLGIDMCAADFK